MAGPGRLVRSLALSANPYVLRLARRASVIPGVSRLLRSGARRGAGRHYLAAVAVVVHDGRILVAEHEFRGGLWALPGGWVNRFEDPAAAAEREVREELGLVVHAVEFLAYERQGRVPELLGYSALTMAFACRLDNPSAGARLSPEIRRVRWRTAEQIDDLSAFERRVAADGLSGSSPV